MTAGGDTPGYAAREVERGASSIATVFEQASKATADVAETDKRQINEHVLRDRRQETGDRRELGVRS